MNADGLTFLLALCFLCVSSNDEPYKSPCEEYSHICETHTLHAPLGSSVLLPCDFSTSRINWVSWAHVKMDVVHLSPEGRIKFFDPRYGRVKVFPNQGSKGNYSITIDELKNSDLGCYRCKQGHNCLQVELVAKIGWQSKEVLLLIYICVGVSAFILFIVGGYCCMKCILWCDNRTQDNLNDPLGVGTHSASAPPFEMRADQQQGGADNLVYENDDQVSTNQQSNTTRIHCSLPGAVPHLDRTQPTPSTSGIYPNLNQFHFERLESQRRKQRFHTELFSRLRQASFSRHYYVNRREISMQQAMSTQAENPRKGLGKKKVKEKCEYKNPIYNRSTDQLNRL